MKFKDWFVSEMCWHSFRGRRVINGVECNEIDFRFEDWERGANPSKHDVRWTMPNSERLKAGESFSARLRDGLWLNITKPMKLDDPDLSFDQWKVMKVTGTAVPLGAPPANIRIMDEQLHKPLPPQWFNFAALYLNGKLVKEPEWPRPEDEITMRTLATPPTDTSLRLQSAEPYERVDPNQS